jgi:hypothetical protein
MINTGMGGNVIRGIDDEGIGGDKGFEIYKG